MNQKPLSMFEGEVEREAEIPNEKKSTLKHKS